MRNLPNEMRTSQSSARHAIYPIQWWWSWLLRSCPQKSVHNFSKGSSLHTQLLKSQLTTQFTLYIHDGADFWEVVLTAHTTSPKSSHCTHNFSKVSSLRSVPYTITLELTFEKYSQKSSHCTHSKLRTASQKSAHYTICPTTWELLKSHLTAHTANWEQLLNSQLTTQFALQHENFSKVDSPYKSLASVCKSWHICILKYSSWRIVMYSSCIQVLCFYMHGYVIHYEYVSRTIHNCTFQTGDGMHTASPWLLFVNRDTYV